jgi:hypothetical protein
MVSAVLPNIDFAYLLTQLQPLVILVGGMVVYLVLIYKFYSILARKHIIKFNLKKHARLGHSPLKKALRVILYAVQYLLLFPIIAFFGFVIMAVLICFMSKETPFQTIMLMSMGVVASVRVSAYYNEPLAKEVAKMLPLALLGIFVVDINYFSLEHTIELLSSAPAYWELGLYYLGFTIVLEFLLRIAHAIITSIWPDLQEAEDEEDDD